MKQPVAEENDESFLPDQEIIAVLCNFTKERKEKRYQTESSRSFIIF